MTICLCKFLFVQGRNMISKWQEHFYIGALRITEENTVSVCDMKSSIFAWILRGWKKGKEKNNAKTDQRISGDVARADS